MLKAEEITQEEYDRWRYRYPEFDNPNIGWSVLPMHSVICRWKTEELNNIDKRSILWHFQKTPLPMSLVFAIGI